MAFLSVKPGAPALNMLVQSGGPGCGIWIPSKAVSKAPEVGPACGPGLPHVWRSKLALPGGPRSQGPLGRVAWSCFAALELLSFLNVMGGNLIGLLRSLKENDGKQ